MKKKKGKKTEEGIDLDRLIREEEKLLPKELLDDMQDYVDFMTGEGKYADK